jgi:hypothetical protein
MLDRAYLRTLLDNLDAVRCMFGDSWHIFRAEAGWCALRYGGGVIFWDGPESLILPFICAERLGDLAGQLCLQEFLAGLSGDELARVYAAGEIPEDLFSSAA